jgi:hypothetical protein
MVNHLTCPLCRGEEFHRVATTRDTDVVLLSLGTYEHNGVLHHELVAETLRDVECDPICDDEFVCANGRCGFKFGDVENLLPGR